MKELFLLLKYSSRNKQRRGESKLLGSNYTMFLFQYILFSFIAGFLYFRMLASFNIVIGGVRFSDIISGIYIIIFSFLFLFNYTPFISINLYDNNFIPFFLTLPVKKSIIFLYSAIETLVYSGFSIAFIFPFSIIFPIIYKTNIIFSIIGFLFFSIFLISIANILGLILVFLVSKTASKIIGTISYLFVVLVFFFLSSREFLTPERLNGLFGIVRIKNIVYYPVSPLSWYLQIVNGDYVYIIYLALLSLTFFYLSLIIPINIDFSISRKRGSRKEIPLKSLPLLSPYIKKDLNFLRRDASSTYILLFAIVYPIFLYFTSKNPYSVLFVFSALNSFYCSVVSTNLYSQEKRVLPLPKVFPARESEIIRSKITIPTFIFFLVFLIIGFFLIKHSKFLIFFSPVILFLNIFESVLSLYFLTRKPDRNYSQKNVLLAYEFLFLEIVSFILTAFLVFLPLLYIEHLSGKFNFNFITRIENIPYLSYLLFIVLPIFIFIFMIYLSFKFFRSVKL